MAQTLGDSNLYPDGSAFHLRHDPAAYHDTDPDRLVEALKKVLA